MTTLTTLTTQAAAASGGVDRLPLIKEISVIPDILLVCPTLRLDHPAERDLNPAVQGTGHGRLRSSSRRCATVPRILPGTSEELRSHLFFE